MNFYRAAKKCITYVCIAFYVFHIASIAKMVIHLTLQVWSEIGPLATILEPVTSGTYCIFVANYNPPLNMHTL
uniref:Uncharacterized protein n=1 Tax=Anguilla anguilla TaxID=7936 RepID=A0A0E9XYH2_ANGAN